MSESDIVYSRLVSQEKLKRGTAYEKLAAVVFQMLNGRVVVHDLKLRGDSGAQHQIDVTVGDGDDQRRVLIECKDYTEKIGLGKVRDFFGAVHDIKPDEAFMLTTNDFTPEARTFASGNGIRLAIFRPVQESDLEGRIKGITTTLKFSAPDEPRVEWIVDEADADRLFPDGLPAGSMVSVDDIRVTEGATSQPFRKMMEDATRAGQLPPGEVGFAGGEVRLAEGVILSAPVLGEMPVKAFKWTQRWHSGSHTFSVGLGIGGLAAELVFKTLDGEVDKIFTNEQIAGFAFEDSRPVERRTLPGV